MDITKPDHRRGPRYIPEEINVIRHSYKAFNKKYPDLISKADYVVFFKLQAQKFQQEIVDNPEGVTLPQTLGICQLVFKEKPKGKPAIKDRAASLSSGVGVSFRNFHSKGLFGSIFWSTEVGNTINRDIKIWSFQGSKKFRSMACKAFREFPNRYKLYIRKWQQ